MTSKNEDLLIKLTPSTVWEHLSESVFSAIMQQTMSKWSEEIRAIPHGMGVRIELRAIVEGVITEKYGVVSVFLSSVGLGKNIEVDSSDKGVMGLLKVNSIYLFRGTYPPEAIDSIDLRDIGIDESFIPPQGPGEAGEPA